MRLERNLSAACPHRPSCAVDCGFHGKQIELGFDDQEVENDQEKFGELREKFRESLQKDEGLADQDINAKTSELKEMILELSRMVSINAKTIIEYKEKYPDAKIWMEPVVPVNSFEEFMDKTNGVIESYEK